MVKKRVKRKLNIKGLIFVLLVLYLMGVLLYTFFTMPIKNIYIKNTNLLKDNEIIEAAGIKYYPSYFKVIPSRLEKKISSLELVNKVDVKKTLTGKVIIDVEEALPLFYNRQKEKIVLSNLKEVDNNKIYLGLPSLINSVPKDIYNDLITSLSKIDISIIKMINEIEYNPDISGEVMIDEYRFLLRMNDGNNVYVNTLNMERLNDYKKFYATIEEDIKGTLYLDSYDSREDLLGLFIPFSQDSGDGSND